MQTRARQILALIALELEKREQAIEDDRELTKLTLEIIFEVTGHVPYQVRYLATSLTELRDGRIDYQRRKIGNNV